MDYIKINGRAFDVGVGISNFEENFNVLDGPNAGRSTGNGRMIRDVLGTCIGHKVTFFLAGIARPLMRCGTICWPTPLMTACS